MKDKRNLHLEVQEHIDCFANTDPLKEMSEIAKDTDKDQAALKWMGLAVLHGINFNAEKLSIRRAPDGTTTVQAKYRRAELPSPGGEIGHDRFRQLFVACENWAGNLAKTQDCKGQSVTKEIIPLGIGQQSKQPTRIAEHAGQEENHVLPLRMPCNPIQDPPGVVDFKSRGSGLKSL